MRLPYRGAPGDPAGRVGREGGGGRLCLQGGSGACREGGGGGPGGALVLAVSHTLQGEEVVLGEEAVTPEVGEDVLAVRGSRGRKWRRSGAECKVRLRRKSLRRRRGTAGGARRTSAGTSLACWDQCPAPSGGTGRPPFAWRSSLRAPALLCEG